MPRPELSDADLRRAWRDCAMVDLSFDRAMQIPAMAIAIRLKAESTARRAERDADRQRADLKCAQANDPYHE